MANTGRTWFKKGQIPHNKIGEDKNCLYCNKKFHPKPAKLREGKGKYCSRKCFILSRANPPVLIICPICNKEFYSRSQKVCSRRCADKIRTKGIIKKCANERCNKETYFFQSELKRGYRYCSQQCMAFSQIPSSIEKILYNYLDMKQIIYERQKQIEFYLLDAYIPFLNLVIEADGVYWHSKPERIRIDKAKDGYLKNRGYRIVRLQEEKILNGEFKKILRKEGI